MPPKKKKKYVAPDAGIKFRHTWKIVMSDKCEACTQQCARGITYMEKMRKPGAIGTGVPCHLTRGKGAK
ncbi:hypothetical protein EBO34_05820 [Alteribacter keqinensis]|uniref:Uncharacterized protein n=1 Tax=Alteribacter keqinensis TaxID=2483800 RepID=A0A3M7TVH5_9BACI|nr:MULTISPECIES: hypothetical protein [Alteribacter]RNA69453.1 hypothetical protein EBO34_05820 [Alteribacter keqinensis]